jgi:hypothetical protein
MRLQASLLVKTKPRRHYIGLTGSLNAGDGELRSATVAELGIAEPKPPPERIEAVMARATTYCTDGRLALRLDEWRGVIESAAFNRALKHRRYRTLASALRSINDPLGRYVQRLYYLQDGSGRSASGLVPSAELGGAPDSLPDDRRWDLRAVLELLKAVAFQIPDDEFTDAVVNVREACEMAIRNYDRALSLALVHLIGHARQDLAMELL